MHALLLPLPRRPSRRRRAAGTLRLLVVCVPLVVITLLASFPAAPPRIRIDPSSWNRPPLSFPDPFSPSFLAFVHALARHRRIPSSVVLLWALLEVRDTVDGTDHTS